MPLETNLPAIENFPKRKEGCRITSFLYPSDDDEEK